MKPRRKGHTEAVYKLRQLSGLITAAVVVGIGLLSPVASADCDVVVRQMRTQHLSGTTLCDLQSRYQLALAKLRAAGVQDPERTGNLYARRLIAKKDWQSYLAKNGDSKFAAWLVYGPRPVIWSQWQAAASIADDDQLRTLFTMGSAEQIEDWLLKLHAASMRQLLPSGEVGAFRVKEEIIPVHDFDDAYTLSDISMIARSPYRSPRTGRRLMNFVKRLCNGQTSPAQLPLKSCGDLTMAQATEVPELMRTWAIDLQTEFKKVSRNPRSVDILSLAARAQQTMIVIHPFIDGNGRTSRLVMDAVLNQFHLPAPDLEDMNQDFFTTPSQWADLIGKGMINAVEAAESCALNPNASGCAVISQLAPNDAMTIEGSLR